MADGSQHQARRFSAFISYNSADAPFARRLHKRLETYRLPRRLRSVHPGSGHPGDEAPDRLKPVFRDADEMTATYDLSTAVREALAQSDYLIVVCSPNSAKSQWVAREIEYFRALHGDTHILAVLIAGTPQTAFPPALLGAAGHAELEPLAADFRKDSGYRRLAMLRLVAELAGVGLDQLVQRDAQRHMRRVVATVSGVAAVLVLVAVLGVLAWNARAETERKREQAGGLVEHLLTDVRANLQRTGRLDQLAAVNESAMAYYQGQDLAKLTDSELTQRAKLLQAMGEDDEKRGELPKARAAFLEAHRTTAKLLAARPNDTARIFAHAQSEYWLGEAAWRARDGAEAKRRFEAYAALAHKLITRESAVAEWRDEVAYAEMNLGMLVLRQQGDGVDAGRHFARALGIWSDRSSENSTDVAIVWNQVDALAWLADSYRVQDRFNDALKVRREQRMLIDGLLKSDPDSLPFRMWRLNNELATARLEIALGNPRQGITHLRTGFRATRDLQRADPTNVDIALQVRAFELFLVLAELKLPLSEQPTRTALANQLGACAPSNEVSSDPEVMKFCNALAESIRPTPVRDFLRSVGDASPNASDVFSTRWGLDFQRKPFVSGS